MSKLILGGACILLVKCFQLILELLAISLIELALPENVGFLLRDLILR